MAKSGFSAVYKQLVKWFVKVVWPWFVKNIWPEIEDRLVEVFVRIANRMKDKLLEWIEQRNSAQEEKAKSKAEEASRMAESATSAAEAEKYRAIAQAWREIAEEFRRENEILKGKLDGTVKQSASEFREELKSVEMEGFIKEGKDGLLEIQGSGKNLQLPAPSDKP